MPTITTEALDLSKQPPRSGSATLGRYPWLARMADKARANKAGTAGDYLPYCEISQHFLDRCGISVDTFDRLIDAGYTDAELVAYFDAHVSDDGRAQAVQFIKGGCAAEIRELDVAEGRAHLNHNGSQNSWERTAQAQWFNDLAHGYGEFTIGPTIAAAYSFDSRFGTVPGNTPEQLLAAAHSACFSMALSLVLGKAGHRPNRINTVAHVTIEQRNGEFTITSSRLECVADVPGLSDAELQKHARTAKDGCPVSRALAGVTITVSAKLVPGAEC